MSSWLAFGLGTAAGTGGYAALSTALPWPLTPSEKRDKARTKARARWPQIDAEADPAVASAGASQVLPRLRLDDRVTGTPWGSLRVLMLVHRGPAEEWNDTEAVLVASMRTHGFTCLGVSASIEGGRVSAIAFRCPPAPGPGDATHAECESRALVDTLCGAPWDAGFVVVTPDWFIVAHEQRSRPGPNPTKTPPKLVGIVTDCHAAIRTGSDAPERHGPIPMARRTQRLLHDGVREVQGHLATL